MLKFKSSTLSPELTKGFCGFDTVLLENDPLKNLDLCQAFDSQIYGGCGAYFNEKSDNEIRVFKAMPADFSDVPDIVPSPTSPDNEENEEKDLEETNKDVEDVSRGETIGTDNKDIEDDAEKTSSLESENAIDENASVDDSALLSDAEKDDITEVADVSDKNNPPYCPINPSEYTDDEYNDMELVDNTENSEKDLLENTNIAEDTDLVTSEGEISSENNELTDQKEFTFKKNEAMESEILEEKTEEKLFYDKPTGPKFPWQAPFAVADGYPGAYVNGLDNRVKMGTEDIPKVGPCFVMSLFGIAQTRTGKNMSATQIKKGFKDLENNNIIRMDPKAEYYVQNSEAVVNYALNILGSDENCRWIDRDENLSKDNLPKVLVGTQATTIYDSKNKHNCQHFVEGDDKGNFLWDPLGEKTIDNIERIDYFKFVPKG